MNRAHLTGVFYVLIFISLVVVYPACARTLTTIDKVLEKTFGGLDDIKKTERLLTMDEIGRIEKSSGLRLTGADRRLIFYTGLAEGPRQGYVFVDAVAGKWGLIHYAVCLDAAGSVKEVIVLSYSEKRGKPVAKKRFLKQFYGKNADSLLVLKKDIQGITGATISSKGVTNGVRKIVHSFKILDLAA